MVYITCFILCPLPLFPLAHICLFRASTCCKALAISALASHDGDDGPCGAETPRGRREPAPWSQPRSGRRPVRSSPSDAEAWPYDPWRAKSTSRHVVCKLHCLYASTIPEEVSKGEINSGLELCPAASFEELRGLLSSTCQACTFCANSWDCFRLRRTFRPDGPPTTKREKRSDGDATYSKPAPAGAGRFGAKTSYSCSMNAEHVHFFSNTKWNRSTHRFQLRSKCLTWSWSRTVFRERKGHFPLLHYKEWFCLWTSIPHTILALSSWIPPNSTLTADCGDIPRRLLQLVRHATQLTGVDAL